MHTPFEPVFQAVEQFEAGAYCSASERSEIDTPFHAHSKSQFIYAEKGTLHIFTATGHFFLPVEHFVWIPRGTEHRIWTNSTHTMMFTIYFDSRDETDGFFTETGIYMVGRLLHELIGFARQWDGHVGPANGPGFKFLQAFQAILPQLSQLTKLPMLGFVRTKNERLRTVLDYLQANLAARLDAASVAARFGLSDRALSRLFHAEGLSFVVYLQSVRIIRAMELLAEKNMNVSLAALHVGYESVAAFSKVFRRFTGLRPKDYLLKYKG